MRNWKLPAVLALAVPLGACDWLTGGHDDDASLNETVSAEGKAEPGQVAVKAPGLDVTFTVPKPLARDVKVHNDIKALYPKASITGMYAADQGGKDGDGSEVEFRFSSADPPDRIAAWYRDPARKAEFKLGEIRQQGGETVITASERGSDNQFKIRLAAKQGGTDGRLIIRDRD